MTFLNETMYSAGLAASWEGRKVAEGPGGWPMYANVTKHFRLPYEISAHDIAGGILGTALSEFNLKNPEIKQLLERYLQGVLEFTAEDRLMLESVSISVVYLIESVHGAGSPQAQRISIQRIYDYKYAEEIAERLAQMSKKSPPGLEPHRAADVEKI